MEGAEKLGRNTVFLRAGIINIIINYTSIIRTCT